ncbi:metallophosphoesterase family protein [Salidesulfovibrio brasiliensis]|uniref:metallophosphoesterase family protein n=1 Tax=Salidesulfovibrio brasiliensis TaxID=221711 RepID=UPI0006D03B3E|nr:YfcE family phosphodiesterase [Salidesulfovibrio brasiliensis]
MLIAVISDTHMTTPGAWLQDVYEKHLAPADALLHCGDITTPAVWSFFMQHPNFHCVRGNCDWDPALVDELDPMLSVKLGGLVVGLTHGWGPRPQVPEKVAEAFGPKYDLVCYGHTHARDWGKRRGVQLCNPGSLGESGSLAHITIGPDGALDCQFLQGPPRL